MTAPAQRQTFHEERDRYYSTIVYRNGCARKYIYDQTTEREGLFNLLLDPGESENLIFSTDKSFIDSLRSTTAAAFDIQIETL